MSIDEVMRSAPVIPVLVLDGSLDPVALAETLVEAGLQVTLRTPSALSAMKAMASVEGAIVGAGTVLNERMLAEAIDSGAQFIVSPGLTESLGKAAIASGVPFLPGTRIPIHAPSRLVETKPDWIVILPWNIRDEIA